MCAKSTRHSTCWILAGLAAGLLMPAVSAAVTPGDRGSTGKSPEAAVDRILRVPHVETENVRLVLLPTNVRDRRGRPVTGLTQDDFRLFEDQVPQDIKYFSIEDQQPIEIAFLLDVSGSMRHTGKLDEAKEAIKYFVDSLRPKDRFALIGFADDQVSWITEFTANRKRFLERLYVQEGYGQTALNDAVAAAPGLVQEAAAGKRAIVLITDGVDNASRLTSGEALRVARQASVPIYAIGFSSIPDELRRKDDETETNLKVLDVLTSETGGLLLPVHDPDDLKEAVARIDGELRYQYVIGYHPKRQTWDGRYHRVQLVATKRGVEVHTRKGYYANP